MVVIKCYFFLNSCVTIRTDPEQNVKTTTTKAKCEMNITLCLLHSITGSDLVLAVGASKAHTTKHPRLHIHQAEHRISTISTEALHFLLVSQENRREVSQSHVIVQWKKQSIFSGLRKKKVYRNSISFLDFFSWSGRLHTVYNIYRKRYWFWKGTHARGDFNLFFAQSAWCAFDWPSVWTITANSRSG